MLNRRLVGLIPNEVRIWYRNRRLAQEVTARTARHSQFLRNEYLPYQFERFGNTVSSKLRDMLEPLLMDFNQYSKNKNLVALRWDDSPHDLYIRRNTSDVVVLVQVFLEKQYKPALCALNHRPGAAFIDCGANIGLASRYFLDAIPGCRAVMIEPSRQNIDVLRRNLFPYGDAVSVVHGALWHTAGLSFDLADTGNLEYGLRCAVKPAVETGSAEPRTYTMDSLLRLVGDTPIGLAKIDIEGGEAAIFELHVSDWISRVGNIAIEIHGEKCEEVVQKAMREYSFNSATCGEISMFTEISRLSALERDVIVESHPD